MHKNSTLTFGLVLAAGLGFSMEARADWSMFNHDKQGSRHASTEHQLGWWNAADLTPKWEVLTPGPVTGTPAVVGGRVYAGDFTGAFYALRAKDGKQRWKTQVAGSITGSALVRDQKVVFGDLNGYVYGLDKKNGSVKWQVRPNPHPWASVYGSPSPVGKNVAIGFSSNEWFAPAIDASYPCCSFRGSVALIDPKNGQVLWHTYFVTEAEVANGSSGVPIWSTPTYDPQLDLIFITSGNNYTEPATALSDSVIALDPQTGAIVWANQRFPDDTWNVLWPPVPPHLDYDIGDSPQVYDLADGTRVVGAGQKSGFYHVLEADTGAEVNKAQFQAPAVILGGFNADTAVADGVVYASTSNYPNYGEIVAFTPDASQELWRFATPTSGLTLSPVAVAKGVVYTTSLDGNLYAIRASDGAPLAQVQIGAHTSGPSVSGGRVFVGTGDGFSIFSGAQVPGSIVSLGAGCDHDDDEVDD
jgi:polyvinyl alcohol dehydrogenase (cytochrome)